MTSNTVGLSTTPSKSKRKRLALSSEKLDAKHSPGLKEILIESEEIYRRTQIRTRTIAPIDYNLLAREIEADDEYSSIVESHSSKSYEETQAFAYIAGILEEVARKFEKQARVQ